MRQSEEDLGVSMIGNSVCSEKPCKGSLLKKKHRRELGRQSGLIGNEGNNAQLMNTGTPLMWEKLTFLIGYTTTVEGQA